MNSKLTTLILAYILLAAGCSVGNRTPSEQTRIITDMAGREVVIPDTIRSAFIDRHSVMMVYAFDTVLPVNRVFNYTETEKRFLKASFYDGKPYALENSVEEIIRLKPDIILYSALLIDENVEQAIQLQEKTQIPVVVMDMDILRYKETLTFMGELLGKEEKAKELVAFIKRYIDPTLEKARSIPAEKKKRIYYAEGMKGLQTDPSGSIHSLLIDLVGAINVAQVDILPGKGMTGVSLEQVYIWNPDLILVWSGNFDGMDSYKEIKSNPAWAKLDAVRNNQVCQVPWKPFGWIDRPPGINRLIGIIWLSHLLYPDVHEFGDVTPIIREYFLKFYHYDMYETRQNNGNPFGDVEAYTTDAYTARGNGFLLWRRAV